MADSLESLPQTCSLDVADRGQATLSQIGTLLNLTRERVRQIEVSALSKLEAHRDALDLMFQKPTE